MEFVRLTQYGNSVYVVVPKRIREKLGLNKGDYVKVYEQNGKIVIEKLNI